MFDWISFLIGLLIGLLLMLIIVWICYDTRTFVFEYCATQSPYCSGINYFNDPGQAIGCAGANIDDILFLNREDELFYRRVQKTNKCIATTDQVVHIPYPQYCLFDINGVAVQGKLITDVDYLLTNGDTIASNPNCQPPNSTGTPLLKWDSIPCST